MTLMADILVSIAEPSYLGKWLIFEHQW